MLSDDVALLSRDYGVECDGDYGAITQGTIYWLSLLLLLLVGFGVPAFMLAAFAASRKRPTPAGGKAAGEGGEGGEAAASGMAAPAERILEAGGKNACLFEDFKPEFAFFDAVDCLRKLSLALLGALWRGTDMQVYLVALTSFIFLMMYVALQPFYLTKSNQLKMAAEAQFFIVVLSSVVLHSKVEGGGWDVLTRTEFGWCMTVGTTCITPLVLVLVNHRHARKLLRQVGDDFKDADVDEFLDKVVSDGQLGKFSFKSVRNDELEKKAARMQREIERLQYTLYEEFGYQEQVDDFVHEGLEVQDMIQTTLNMKASFDMPAPEPPGYDPDLPDEYQPAPAAAQQQQQNPVAADAATAAASVEESAAAAAGGGAAAKRKPVPLAAVRSPKAAAAAAAAKKKKKGAPAASESESSSESSSSESSESESDSGDEGGGAAKKGKGGKGGKTSNGQAAAPATWKPGFSDADDDFVYDGGGSGGMTKTEDDME